MGLLKSVNDVPGIDYYEYRDGLYYNSHEYRMRVSIPHGAYRDWETDRKSTRLNSSHSRASRMPSSA